MKNLVFFLSLLVLWSAYGFVVPRMRVTTHQKLTMATGGHNQGFKFIPTTKLERDEFWPQILPIAGVYGEMTPEQLYAPPRPALPEQGYWSYDFSNPDMHQLGTVAFPGSERLALCDDPVAVIATNTQLGISLEEEVECLVVVDRADRVWTNSQSFYLFETPSNQIVIMWSDEGVPTGHTILGRIAVVSVPLTEQMRGSNSMFAEE